MRDLDRHDSKLRIEITGLVGERWWRLSWRGFVLGHYSTFAKACKFAAIYKEVV